MTTRNAIVSAIGRVTNTGPHGSEDMMARTRIYRLWAWIFHHDLYVLASRLAPTTTERAHR